MFNIWIKSKLRENNGVYIYILIINIGYNLLFVRKNKLNCSYIEFNSSGWKWR